MKKSAMFDTIVHDQMEKLVGISEHVILVQNIYQSEFWRLCI